MRILVIGGGGREHALAWKLAQSPKISRLYIAPGNAGTAQVGENVPLRATDISGLVEFAVKEHVDLTVVGPEAPLVERIVDHFLVRGKAIFGPTSKASRIEASKSFARGLMDRAGVPHAPGMVFDNFDGACEYLSGRPLPAVIKADGLAGGKGVSVVRTVEEGMEVLHKLMKEKTCHAAGERVVIEDFLTGREMSAFALTDAHSIAMMVPACDYKKAFEDDQGPNTGGMGSYSPPEFFTPELERVVASQIIKPVIDTMHSEGYPFKGVLYAGLMITEAGPRVLEFNARFGDPETQVILPLLDTDLVEVMMAVVENSLHQITLHRQGGVCVGVVLASEGYPGEYRTGLPVSGLNDLDPDVLVFHAGTTLGPQGQVLTSGGRVLTVVGRGENLTQARARAYDNISRIHFEGAFYRRDIGLVN